MIELIKIIIPSFLLLFLSIILKIFFDHFYVVISLVMKHPLFYCFLSFFFILSSCQLQLNTITHATCPSIIASPNNTINLTFIMPPGPPIFFLLLYYSMLKENILLRMGICMLSLTPKCILLLIMPMHSIMVCNFINWLLLYVFFFEMVI